MHIILSTLKLVICMNYCRFVMNALKAKEFYRRDVQYIVRNGKALIINEVFPALYHFDILLLICLLRRYDFFWGKQFQTWTLKEQNSCSTAACTYLYHQTYDNHLKCNVPLHRYVYWSYWLCSSQARSLFIMTLFRRNSWLSEPTGQFWQNHVICMRG